MKYGIVFLNSDGDWRFVQDMSLFSDYGAAFVAAKKRAEFYQASLSFYRVVQISLVSLEV